MSILYAFLINSSAIPFVELLSQISILFLIVYLKSTFIPCNFHFILFNFVQSIMFIHVYTINLSFLFVGSRFSNLLWRMFLPLTRGFGYGLLLELKHVNLKMIRHDFGFLSGFIFIYSGLTTYIS